MAFKQFKKNDHYEEIKKLIKELQADSFKKGISWKGYEVYEPIYKEDLAIGEPTVVLVKDGEIRFSTYDESFEYLRFSQGE